VALVNMPFSFSKYPSIQLGTLSALLKSQGIPVDCHHLNVRFAHKIGVPLYELICEKRALFGEWLFSYLLFRDNPKRAEYPRVFKPVFEQIARESGQPIGYFEEMATKIGPQFLTWALTAMQEIKAGTFWINDPLTDNDAAPFGGMRKSGMGRELGEEGLDAFRETKHVHLDFIPERKAFWFPYRQRRAEIPS